MQIEKEWRMANNMAEMDYTWSVKRLVEGKKVAMLFKTNVGDTIVFTTTNTMMILVLQSCIYNTNTMMMPAVQSWHHAGAEP